MIDVNTEIAEVDFFAFVYTLFPIKLTYAISGYKAPHWALYHMWF